MNVEPKKRAKIAHTYEEGKFGPLRARRTFFLHKKANA